MPHTKKSICVFCGSRFGGNPAFESAAAQVGAMIARRGWRLVYGAGDVGLMGTVARAADTGGGETFGVIPQHLMSREVGKKDLTHLIVTENMHERKKIMFMNSDAILVLPGGAGSLDEFFEVLTWRQLGLHEKPIILLDIDGYWQPLLALMEHIIDQGFAGPGIRDFMITADNCDQLDEVLSAALT